MRMDKQMTVALAAVAMSLAAVPAQARTTATLKTLHSFCPDAGCPDGRNPQDSLVMGMDGNIYGTTTYGGPGDLGTVFQLIAQKHGKWTFNQIYHFTCQFGCPDGFHPFGKLVQDSAGNLYGVTQFGGSGGGVGSIYELGHDDHNNWSLKATYSFPCSQSGCPNGNDPAGSLTYAGAASGAPYDGVSPLYGATYFGGSDNQGVAFTAVPQGSTFAVTNIMSFPSGALGNPNSGFLMDAAGHLFGTNGTCCNPGSVFELQQTSGIWFPTQLYSFQGKGNGMAPAAGLIQDATGALFGASIPIGLDQRGVVFKLVPNGGSSQFTALYAFCAKTNCKDGDDAQYGPVMDANGVLFGATSEGGKYRNDFDQVGGGTIYKFNGTRLKTLYSFCAKANCADGAYPSGRVILDAKGNIYGVTYRGGANGDGGTVFELIP